ncbi:hypothetical protein D3C81_1374540 [compost metagenome]
MRLVDPREAEADAVGALVQAIGHRDRHRRFQAAVVAGLAQVLEQHIAPQRVAHRIERRQWAAGAQVADSGRQVFADTRVVAARQQVGFPGAAAPVDGHAGPAACRQRLLQTDHVQRTGGAGEAMQGQHQRCAGLVWAVPVQVEEVAIVQPQALAAPLQTERLAAEGRPEGLQVGAGQPPGGLETGAGGRVGMELVHRCCRTSGVRALRYLTLPQGVVDLAGLLFPVQAPVARQAQ